MYSEHGQDKWLEENIFKDKTDGVFVEFGALEGIQYIASVSVRTMPYLIQMDRLILRCLKVDYSGGVESRSI
jgi:hypothetical protein